MNRTAESNSRLQLNVIEDSFSTTRYHCLLRQEYAAVESDLPISNGSDNIFF